MNDPKSRSAPWLLIALSLMWLTIAGVSLWRGLYAEFIAALICLLMLATVILMVRELRKGED